MTVDLQQNPVVNLEAGAHKVGSGVLCSVAQERYSYKIGKLGVLLVVRLVASALLIYNRQQNQCHSIL